MVRMNINVFFLILEEMPLNFHHWEWFLLWVCCIWSLSYLDRFPLCPLFRVFLNLFLLKKNSNSRWCWAEREWILDTDCCPGTSPISFSYNLQSWGISAWTESVCFLLTPLALSHPVLLPGPGLSRPDCTACECDGAFWSLFWVFRESAQFSRLVLVQIWRLLSSESSSCSSWEQRS